MARGFPSKGQMQRYAMRKAHQQWRRETRDRGGKNNSTDIDGEPFYGSLLKMMSEVTDVEKTPEKTPEEKRKEGIKILTIVISVIVAWNLLFYIFGFTTDHSYLGNEAHMNALGWILFLLFLFVIGSLGLGFGCAGVFIAGCILTFTIYLIAIR